MAFEDLKDAYYSISMAEEDRKFLMFEWKGQYYHYTRLPNGLSSAKDFHQHPQAGLCKLTFYWAYLYGAY